MHVEHTEHSYWYFAYGANMSADVFKERRSMRPTDRAVGRLDGYSIAFNQPGIPLLEPGFANLRPDSNGVVHGVLWKISEQDFARLDLQEGGGDAYDRLRVRVATVAGRITARTYITQAVVEGLKPSRRYRDLLVRGAEDAGLDEAYTAALRRVAVHELPGLSSLSPHIMRLFERAFEKGLNPKPLFDFYWNRRRQR